MIKTEAACAVSDAPLIQQQFEAIDEILEPYEGPMIEVLRRITKMVHAANMENTGIPGEQGRAIAFGEFLHLIDTVFCDPDFGAMALLPHDVRQHLRRAMRPGNLAAVGVVSEN